MTRYMVFRVFGPTCWRRCLPLMEHERLVDAIAEADQKHAEYHNNDEATFAVSTHRDGPELYRISNGKVDK